MKGSQTERLNRMGKVGSMNPKRQRQWVRYRPGERIDDPIVCGAPNHARAVFVECDAMVHGLRHGELRWVTGEGVQEALDEGWFIPADAPVIIVVEETGPDMPVAAEPAKLHTNVMYCSDCTMTWSADRKNPSCTCDPPDPAEWKILSR